MEKADQNTQCSSKGAFDAASLLVVEEMLGHLYARPPSAEIKSELPVSDAIYTTVIYLFD